MELSSTEAIPWAVIVPVTTLISVLASVAGFLAMKWGYAWRTIYNDAKRAAERRFSWLTIYSRSRSQSLAAFDNSESVLRDPSETATSRIHIQDHEICSGRMNSSENPQCSQVNISDYVPISELMK